jgi:hypothetical protein
MEEVDADSGKAGGDDMLTREREGDGQIEEI